MDTLQAFKINFQSIYRNQDNARTCAINMIDFGHKQFQSMYKYQNFDKLEELCEKGKFESEDIDLIQEFTFNELTDNIKLGICFENLLKAILLSNLYLVHNIDHNLFRDLAKRQKREPVLFDDLFKLSRYHINRQINSEEFSLREQVKGLKEQTINYSILIGNEKYLKHFNLPKRLIRILRTENEKRNKLHLYNHASFEVNKSVCEDLQFVFMFIKNNVSNWLNELFQSLQISPENRKLSMMIRRNHP